MNIIENIKGFLKEQGLNWTGEIITGKDKDFREATLTDFDKIKDMDFRISFGKDGEIALSIEIDLINFKIQGETFDFVYNCYAGVNDKNRKLCEERDLSEDWVKYQLKSCGLVYAVALKNACEEKKAKIEEERNRKEKQLERKIEYLARSKDKVIKNADTEIKKLEDIESLADQI